MTILRRFLVPMIATVLSAAAVAEEGHGLRSGLYEIEYSLELPHLERYAIVRSATFCIDARRHAFGPPIPVMGANNAFEGCAVENLRSSGSFMAYDIACRGRDAARAHALYRKDGDTFKGRVAMIMGAKNMTMTEVQAGRRLGNCSLAAQ